MLDNNDLNEYIRIVKQKISELKKTVTDLEDIYLFEAACIELDFHLEKYFREDISTSCMYSCQIVLNHLNLKSGTGINKENAYENALFVNFKNSEKKESLVLVDIRENLLNIDICNSFFDHCRKYFSKKRSNNNYYNMKEYIKREIGSEMILKEEIEYYTQGQYICSIFLNENLLLHQGSVINYDKNNLKLAKESTITDFLNSYSIYSTEVKPNQFHPTVKDILEELHFYFKNKTDVTSYFSEIKNFANEKQYPLKIYFSNGVSTIEINNLKIARAEEEDEYCSYILLGRVLLAKINQFQSNMPINGRVRLSSSNSSSSVIPKSSIKPEKSLGTILKEISVEANNERNSNELTPYWSILARLFRNFTLNVEPLYNPDQGNIICRLMLNNKEIARSTDTNKEKSREAAAKVFVDFYLSKGSVN